MSGRTQFYGLTYFTYGDELGDGVNVQKEVDRFMTIDKQLFGLYSVFGNGVISGWNLSSRSLTNQNSISLDVSPGYGIINSFASQTELNSEINNLPTNDSFDIYAVLTGSNPRDREVSFQWSRTGLGSYAIRLARVTTNDSGITNIDANFRQEIGFLELIKDEINNHKHRGSPSKINLQTETKNQLPSARIEDFGAEKITSGRFNTSIIPQLNHQDLEGTGLLTHAALDSFVKLITSGNRQLLGEVASINIMKLITAQFFLGNKLNINITDIVDFPNMLFCYPGITPNTVIDFNATTANISLSSQCISGKPVKQGSMTSVSWNTNAAFLGSVSRQNVSISQNSVSLSKGGINRNQIEGFEQVQQSGVAIPGFTTQIEVTLDNTGVFSENTETFKTEGFYSGRFETQREYRILYRKKVTQNKDWSAYDELVLDVKSISISHGAVYMYFVNGEGSNSIKSDTFLLLSADEITDNIDSSFNSFERRVFDISKINKNNISEIIFYTDDLSSKQTFWIDNIFLRNKSLYPFSGFIRFRYSGNSPVVFNSIDYEADIPDGCDLRVRIRSANSTALLDRSVFTPNLNSGSVFSLQGTDAEIDVILVSNDARDKTPVLNKIDLKIITDGQINGFTISNSQQWNRGSYVNSELQLNEINNSEYEIAIENPVSVGNLYYIYQNGFNENDPNGLAVNGFRGLLFSDLISPNQAINIASSDFALGFNSPLSAYRLPNKNIIIADTSNDRVVEVSSKGEFIRGLGGHNITDSSYFYPICSVYNDRKSILTICFSQEIDINNININKIKLWIGSANLFLGEQDKIVDSGKNSKILEIKLSEDKSQQLEVSSDVYVDFTNGLFATPLQYPPAAKKLFGQRGLKVFVGDFSFINEISKPIFANVTSKNNWLICNSKINVSKINSSSTSSIDVKVGETTTFTVEVDPPQAGFELRWEQNIPADIQSIVTFSSGLPGNSATVTVNSPTESQIRTWQLVFTAVYIRTSTRETVGSSQNTVVLNILSSDLTGSNQEVNVPSLVEINPKTETILFSYNDLTFSDFTLGSVFDVDSEKLLISGLYKESDPLPGVSPSPTETYEQQAIRKLNGYRGKTVIINKNDKSITFEYIAADNSYPSDSVFDSNNNIVIAETSFINNSGRVIKLDNNGNIVWQIGNGLFSQVNDVRSQFNGDLIVST